MQCGTWLILELMADGRWYARPSLRGRFEAAGFSYSYLSSRLSVMTRRHLLLSADNPLFKESPPQGMRRYGQSYVLAPNSGVTACRYVYRISDHGRDRLERYQSAARLLG